MEFSFGSIKKIGIIGLGQIGGSIAMILKKKVEEIYISGCDRNENILKMAYFLDYKTNNISALKDHDLIFLAVPVFEIKNILEILNKLDFHGIIVDTGSTKKIICEKASNLKIKFVGGHPLAGSEKTAPEAWNDKLLEGKPFFICDVKKDPIIVKIVMGIVTVMGARPILVDPEEHDRMLALTSHLPYLISIAFIKNSADKIFEGPGFKSFTRIAYQNPEMFADTVLSNKENIRKWFEIIKNDIDFLLRINNKEQFIKWVRRNENCKTR